MTLFAVLFTIQLVIFAEKVSYVEQHNWKF